MVKLEPISHPESSDLLQDIRRESEELKPVSEILEKLEEVKVDLLEDVPEPESIITLNDSVIATRGNFSLLIGKAKSRKTFFVVGCISSYLTGNPIMDGIRGTEFQDPKTILFDTEQGKHHLHKSVNRINRLTDGSGMEHLEVFGLRKFDAAQRLEMIERKIYATKGLGFVVIDGVRDIVTSINDEEQASRITSKLLKWTEELNIHLMVVLHQNKNDGNARGHLGTELVNKAETTLSVKKADRAKEISVVEAEYCRDKEPEPLAFEIDQFGLPVLAKDYEIRTAEKRRGFIPAKMEQYKLFQLLTSIFSRHSEIGYGELVKEIVLEYGNQFGEKLSQANAKILVTYSKGKKWIKQKEERKPYELGQYQSE